MNKILFSIVMSLLFSMTIFSGTAQARLKCWVSNEGIKECGDKVPPEYAQDGYQELDGQSGVLLGKTERAKTDEELVEARRLEKIAADKERKKKAQERQDHILLNTFSSVKDIERARNDRIATIESSIKLTGIRSDKVSQELDKLINAAADTEKNGKEPSDDLLKDIESLKRRLKNNDSFMAEKMIEQIEVKEEHNHYIDRFKELKGIGE